MKKFLFLVLFFGMSPLFATEYHVPATPIITSGNHLTITEITGEQDAHGNYLPFLYDYYGDSAIGFVSKLDGAVSGWNATGGSNLCGFLYPYDLYPYFVLSDADYYMNLNCLDTGDYYLNFFYNPNPPAQPYWITSSKITRVGGNDWVAERFLGFPLAGLTPYTATISAVVDHHNDNGFNCADNVVTAYTGEEGSDTYDASSWSTTATGSGCSGYLYGFAKESGTFSLGGQYDTSANNEYGAYLFYDGHTGYDYPRNNGTSVKAAAAGTAYYEGNNNDVKIDHGNGYYTYYLHLQSRTITTDGQSVPKGEEIGTTGSGHLHFTVKKGTTRVDPYGWTGTGADPLQIDGHDNICLWDACP